MAIRIYKPTTPGRRNASVNLHVEVTKKSPEKSLLAPLSKTGGRNNQGKKTVRGRGGGHKRRYRRIDFRRTKDDMAATVVGIEYDPKEFANRAINGTDLLVFVQLSRLAELGISQSARRRVIVPRLQTLALAPASAPQMHAASGGRV